MALLSVEDLEVTVSADVGPVRALRGISFELERGRVLGIVGESGSGKSMTALAIMQLLPEGARASGRIRMGHTDLLSLPEREMCLIRGNVVSMIFQEPMTSLNPLHTIGDQVTESLKLHRGLLRHDADREALRLLEQVGIPNAAAKMQSYPYQLSGGQRQRAMIAIAVSCGPDLLIADEPTTALDVTTQSQVLDLLDELVEDTGMSMILISHNLAMVGERCDDMAVMYGGSIVERGPTPQVFASLAHPYTRGLFAALPVLGGGHTGRLQTIPGTVPDLADLGAGCAFADRCDRATALCLEAQPPAQAVGEAHFAACNHLHRGNAP